MSASPARSPARGSAGRQSSTSSAANRILAQRLLAAFEFGQVEDGGEEGEQALARALDRLDIVDVARVAQRTIGLVPHQFGKADDVVERRADVVAEMGEEGGLGAARGLGLELFLVVAAGQQALLFLDRGEERFRARTSPASSDGSRGLILAAPGDRDHQEGGDERAGAALDDAAECAAVDQVARHRLRGDRHVGECRRGNTADADLGHHRFDDLQLAVGLADRCGWRR